MKRLLRIVLAFLERKFPDKLEITVQEYKELREELGSLNQAVQSIVVLDAKIKELKAEMSLIAANLGLAAGKRSFNPLER